MYCAARDPGRVCRLARLVAAELRCRHVANFGVENLLEQARPVGMLGDKPGVLMTQSGVPDEHAAHARRNQSARPAIGHLRGCWPAFLLATIVLRVASSIERRNQFNGRDRSITLLWNKWWFDELYDLLFVRPTLCDQPVHRRSIRHAASSTASSIRWRTSTVARLRSCRSLATAGSIDNFVDTVRREDVGPRPVAAIGANRPLAAVRDVHRRWHGGPFRRRLRLMWSYAAATVAQSLSTACNMRRPEPLTFVKLLLESFHGSPAVYLSLVVFLPGARRAGDRVPSRASENRSSGSRWLPRSSCSS